MQSLKKYLGIVWMLIGPAVFIMLVTSATTNINASGKGDISNPVPWIIIITVFLPIAIGLTVFGWYCWKGEYEND